MEILLITLLMLAVIVVFDVAAVALGVDSRDFSDPQAPFPGAV